MTQEAAQGREWQSVNLLTDQEGNLYEVPSEALSQYRMSDARRDEMIAAHRTPDADTQGFQQYGYTVRPGDNLWHIAHQVYGDGRYWPLLYQANRHQLYNPHLIHPGQVLRVP